MYKKKIQIGDVVRFLNETGGGKVTRIDEKQGLLYVEDKDGFEIPILERECIIVPNVNKKTNFPLKSFGSQTQEKTVSQEDTSPTIEKTENLPLEIYETEYGDDPNIFLVFIPQNIKNLRNTQFDVLLLNDSNYFLFYNILIGDDFDRQSVSNGIIEPNIQEQIVNLSTDNLNDWENLHIQLIAYKKGKTYTPQATIDFKKRLSPIKFYKLHSFRENDYFDEEVMRIKIINHQKLQAVSAEDIRKAMLQKDASQPQRRPRPRVKNKRKQILEIDLHIHELIDTTAGMDNAAMLQLQLDKVESVLKENQNKKGQRIVFIHGKGEGVLRSEVLKLLKQKHKTYYVQDASFKEYGFGATMVTIR